MTLVASDGVRGSAANVWSVSIREGTNRTQGAECLVLIPGKITYKYTLLFFKDSLFCDEKHVDPDWRYISDWRCIFGLI